MQNHETDVPFENYKIKINVYPYFYSTREQNLPNKVARPIEKVTESKLLDCEQGADDSSEIAWIG